MMNRKCVMLCTVAGLLLAQMSQAMGKNGASEFATDDLERGAWKVQASATRSEGQAPVKVIDGKVNTRWTSGAFQKGGEWLSVDMGERQAFNEIELFQSKTVNDYPRAYEVYVSQDGENWGTPVAKGKGQEGESTFISFRMVVEARFVKIVQTGTADANWWSVHEIYIRKK